MFAKQTILGLCTAVLLGCGGPQMPKPQSMPAGATFYGVWQSPQYGNMHLCQNGDSVIGDYAKHERSGRIQGSIEGDLLTFQWEDQREMIAGRPTTRRGHGYFRIAIGEDGDQYISGEWGLDEAFSGGGPWNAVKLRRGQPDRCDGAAANAPVGVEAAHPWDEED